MLKLEVLRYSSGEETTLGLLSDVSKRIRKFLCFTLEDEYRAVKVAGETRIPAGEYKVTLRTTGGKTKKYARKYPDMHKGMLWIRDVPGFKYVLIHVGNNDDDTEGCLLLGSTAANNVDQLGTIGASVRAYKRVYPQIAERLAAGEEVTIKFIDRG